MKLVHTPEAPEPAGHYSQAVVHGGVVYVAGMLGHDPADPEADVGGPAEQARRALRNVEKVLEAAGSGLDRVLRMVIYVSDVDHWGPVNEAYAAVMGEHRPARAIVPVRKFRDPYVLEVVATAAVD